MTIIQHQVAFSVEGDIGLPIRVLRQPVHDFDPVPGNQADGDGVLMDPMKIHLPLTIVNGAAMEFEIMRRFPQHHSHRNVVMCALVGFDATDFQDAIDACHHASTF